MKSLTLGFVCHTIQYNKSLTLLGKRNFTTVKANRGGVKITPSVTQLTDGIAAKFQRLYPHFRGPAFQRNE